MKKNLLLIVCILLIFAVWTYQNQAAEELDLIEVFDKQKGVCWVGSPRPLEGWELDSLRIFGVTHISQTPFGWQEDPNLPDIRWEKHTDRMWWGESLDGLEFTTNLGREKGIESILKPHLWVKGEWPGAISMNSEKDWEQWFEYYAEFILYYAGYAESHQIPILCIGTELELSSGREKEWRSLIKEIRLVYHGELTYAANFTEYEKVRFWDALDYIGIQAYFPLTDKTNPDLITLKKGWEKKIKEIEKVQKRFHKPVIFTEIGYCNTVDAAIEPWIWPNERREVALSEEVQSLCYQAFFESVWDKNWLAGAYFWKWYPQPRDRDPDFTPQNKKAQEVMRSFYTAEF
jgi:hypothetical protein